MTEPPRADGADGANGTDGADGTADGADGTDGAGGSAPDPERAQPSAAAADPSEVASRSPRTPRGGTETGPARLPPPGPDVAAAGAAERRARVRVLRVTLVGAGAATSGVGVAALLLVQAGREPAAFGLGLGYATALLATLTWVVGAVRTYHAPWTTLAGATIGLWPLRLGAVAVAFGVLPWWLGPRLDTTWLFASFAAAFVAGHGVEAWALAALGRADAGDREARGRPA